MEQADSPQNTVLAAASDAKSESGAPAASAYPALGVRQFGRFNWLGLWTLYKKEVRRFTKVWMQTLMAPIVTTLLFLAIFSLALAGLRPDINGVPFINFLAPGLIMMSIVQNAFANSSSSLLVAKVQGNVVDFLMPPLSPLELNIGITFGGLTRGLFVGIGTFTAMSFFVDFTVHSFFAALFYACIASLLLGQIGLLGGIWADKFDHLATISNFIITPLAFLSGTFYSVTQLPEFAYNVTQYNPFFYMIDGFRYALTGHAEGSLLFGAGMLIGLTLIGSAMCQFVLARGWRLKS
ncbi:MAG: ABC transporter permease [Alphaproteobacteria bacterium]|nr:ABC transporter permease [Alphaproteobacteria bacterium]